MYDDKNGKTFPVSVGTWYKGTYLDTKGFFVFIDNQLYIYGEGTDKNSYNCLWSGPFVSSCLPTDLSPVDEEEFQFSTGRTFEEALGEHRDYRYHNKGEYFNRNTQRWEKR